MPYRRYPPQEMQLELARQQEAYRARVANLYENTSVFQAMSLAQYADMMPTLDPDLAVGLASQGVSPFDEAAQRVAARHARIDTVGSAAFGEVVNAGPRSGEPMERPELESPEDTRTFGELGAGEKVGRAVSNTARGFARGAFLGFSSLLEEVSAGISSVGEAAFDGERGFLQDAWENYTNQAAPSGLRLAGGELLGRIREDGFQADDLWRDSEDLIGRGWIPGGDIRDAREEQKHNLELDGTFVTPGRLIARMVSQPGDRAYGLVSGAADLGLNLLDPVNFVIPGGAAGSKLARVARKAAEGGSEGAALARKVVPGLRRYDERVAITAADEAKELIADLRAATFSGSSRGVVPGAVRDLFTNRRAGQRMVAYLVDETSPSRIIEGSKKGIDPETAARFAKAGDEIEVLDILDDVLGSRVTSLHTPRKAGPRFRDRTFNVDKAPLVKRKLHGIRIAGGMPGTEINPTDIGGTASTLADVARNSKIEEDVWRPIVDEYVSNASKSHGALRDGTANAGSFNAMANHAMAKLMKATKDSLDRYGYTDDLIAEMTELNAGSGFRNPIYVADRSGLALSTYGTKASAMAYDSSGNLIQTSNLSAPTTMQQMGEYFWGVPDLQEIRRHVSAWSAVTSKTGWRLSQNALRSVTSKVFVPAVLARGALTLRAVGEEQARIAMAGRDGLFNHPFRLMAWAVGLDPSKRRKLMKALGSDFTDAGISNDALKILDEYEAAMGGTLDLLMPGGTRGGKRVRHQTQTRRLGKDDPKAMGAWARQLAMLSTDPQARMVARMGPNRYADKLLGSDPDMSRMLREMNATIFADNPIVTKADALRHAHDINRRVIYQTGRDHRLMQWVANADWDGVPLTGEHWDSNTLARVLADAGYGPGHKAMPDGVVDLLDTEELLQKGGMYDRMVEGMFDFLITKPSDGMSRSPLFAQHFTERFRQAAAYASDSIWPDVAAKADEFGIDLSGITRNGDDAFDRVDDIVWFSADHASTQVRGFLYDSANRSQFGDMMRAILPFVDPWADTAASWSKLIAKNPAIANRGYQIYDATSGDSSYFFEDDFGNSQFAIGGVSWLFNAVAGGNERVGVEAVGRTRGLNLLGTGVTPGFGPIVTIPTAAIMDAKPLPDKVEQEMFPFGRPGDQGQGIAEQALDAVTASWGSRLKKVFARPESDRAFAGTVRDVMVTLAAGGGYMDSEGAIRGAEMRRLVEDAKGKARGLYGLSALASFVTPTPTSFRFEANLPDGVITTDALAKEYRKLQQEDPTTATSRFIERYGMEYGLLMQSASYATGYRNVGEAGVAWEVENRELAGFAPNYFGVFAPNYGENDPLDPAAFARQFITGDREHLEPDEHLRLYNNIVGRTAYYKARDDMVEQGLPEQMVRVQLASLKNTLQDLYPGYDSTESTKKKIPTHDAIRELSSAIAESPELAATEAGQGIAKYLRLRQAAIDAGAALSDTQSENAWATGSGVGHQQLRARVREAAEEVIRDHPDFAVAYDRVFEREMRQDDPGVLPSQARRSSIPSWMVS